MGWVGSVTSRRRFTPRYLLCRRLGRPKGGLGLDTGAREEILRLGSNPGRPLRTQTLHWLNYLAHYSICTVLYIANYYLWTDSKLRTAGWWTELYIVNIAFSFSFFLRAGVLYWLVGWRYRRAKQRTEAHWNCWQVHSPLLQITNWLQLAWTKVHLPLPALSWQQQWSATRGLVPHILTNMYVRHTSCHFSPPTALQGLPV
jgi:hypothetical protein